MAIDWEEILGVEGAGMADAYEERAWDWLEREEQDRRLYGDGGEDGPRYRKPTEDELYHQRCALIAARWDEALDKFCGDEEDEDDP